MRVEWIATGGPDGDTRAAASIEDGIVSAAPDAGEADLRFTAPFAVFSAIRAGELDESVAFMQGRLKVVGSMGRFMELMPLFGGDELLAVLAASGLG